MKGSILQKLLNKQKQDKFGDAVTNNRWDELVPNILNGVSKFEDVIVPIKENGKILSLLEFITSTQDQSPAITSLINKIIGELNYENHENEPAAQFLKDMVLRLGSQSQQIIDLIIRNFMTQEDLFFSEAINEIIDASQSFISNISSSITKYFPQTNFDGTQQLYYLKSTLNICSHCHDVTLAVLSRVFQHLVGLDCELMISSKDESGQGALEIDEDIALILTPQIMLVLDFIENYPHDIFPLLLQLFDLYVIDLPSSSTVQFIFFIAASFGANQYETFVGYLLHKMIDNSVSSRTRGNAAFYLMTICARARYIDDHFAIACLSYVVNFATCYIDHVKKNNPRIFTRNTQSHSVFYYALQCVAYVCVWRNEQWRQSGIDIEEKWRISSLFNNELDPMTAIDKNTAEMFGQLGLVEYDPDEITIDRIDVWFPFDPCPLDEVRERVEPIYIEWGEEAEPGDINAVLDQSLNKICASRGISFDDFSFDKM